MGWHVVRYSFTLDRKRGFGVLFNEEKNHVYQDCFYEDGSLAPAAGLEIFSYAIDRLARYGEDDPWGPRMGPKTAEKYRKLVETGSAAFIPGKDGAMTVRLTAGTETAEIRVQRGNYSFDVQCGCGKSGCPHIKAAATLMRRRLDALQHAYAVTDLPVDKSVFLDPLLTRATENLDTSVLNTDAVEDVRKTVDLLGAANSAEYNWLYYDFLLEMSPGYSYYDARFLEDSFTELMLGLFEDPRFRASVAESDHFCEAEEYEERQYRSNRASMKRVWKAYRTAVRELDEKGDYSQDPAKEFLLKYRDDRAGLLRYYAEGKEELEEADLPFLSRIAEAARPEGTDGGERSGEGGTEELRPDSRYVGPVAKKMDGMEGPEAAAPVLEKLIAGLPKDRVIEIYSGLRNLSMSFAEIMTLGREDQLRMVRNIPLTAESFTYIMDNLLRDRDAAERGRFILFAANRARSSRNGALKTAVARQAGMIPDNRLLLRYVLNRLQTGGNIPPRPGDPARELKTFFSCDYEISRENNQLRAYFTVLDPEGGAILLDAVESESGIVLRPSEYAQPEYTAELIRQVCLEGKEEKYREAFEAGQDAVAAALFEQKNRQFAKGYQQLCATLTDGKMLLAETEKVRIEWMIYREGTSSALAFRVGRSRMYIVRDAVEFMKAFRSGETKEYGRDLILTHDPDNLEDGDAAIIRFLVTAKYMKGRLGEPGNKRYISISDALLGNVLEHLEGRNILYNDQLCLVRMEPRKIRLRISGKYVLSTDISRKNQEFLNLMGKGYLVTRGEKDSPAVLDRVAATAEEISLISLVDQNPSVSIQPILKDFRKNVYARFFEMFDVDPAVQREFTLSQIRLNTYLDFERGAVTARTEILRDGKEIRAAELTDRIDRAKIELLDSYLASLGFAEGKLEEESRVLAFFKMDFTRMKKLTNVYLSENLKNKELKSVGKPVIRVTYQNNLARVFLEKSEFTEAELEKIIAGLRKKRKYILLDGERIVDLDSETARDFGDTVRDFGMDPKDLYRKKTVSMINAIKAFAHERSCRIDRHLRDMIEEIRGFKDSEIPIPALNAQLRDYQAEGFRWLSILAKYGMGGILADDMGLGKTLQTIALIRSDRTHKPSLVVCPKSLVFNWESEFARFDGKTRVRAVYGTDPRRSEIIAGINWQEKAVYVTSYDSLRNDIAKYTGDFNYVILDEAQYIKNVNALKTRSVKELKAAHRFALTGTPIENSVVDLWSIFDFIMPGYLEELSAFRDADPAAIARKAGPFILRRVKEDVLEDLPPKYERILSAEMTGGQRKLYDAMRQEARTALEEGGKAFDMLPWITRLRQVCVDPGMFVENYGEGSGKMEMLAGLIPEYLEAGHRILIFSQFVKALESVRGILDEKGIPCYFLSGDTPARDRITMMDAFNNGSGTDVFLISLKAGGTGLNLIGADTVIHLDPWWNVAAENQASDRTHRIGQTRNVEVIRLIAAESIEQRVVELQDLKKQVIRQVISDDDGSVTSASLEDIAFVLG